LGGPGGAGHEGGGRAAFGDRGAQPRQRGAGRRQQRVGGGRRDAARDDAHGGGGGGERRQRIAHDQQRVGAAAPRGDQLLEAGRPHAGEERGRAAQRERHPVPHVDAGPVV